MKGDRIVSVQVKLKDIMDEMETLLEESHSFLNVKTGEIVWLTTEDLIAAEDEEPFDHLPQWQQENRSIAMDVVDHSKDYIELPTKYDVNEYEIIDSFCFTVGNQKKQESLLRAIKGKGAFRRFKEKIVDFNMEDQWYSYRNECFKQIAIEWCQGNNISFIE